MYLGLNAYDSSLVRQADELGLAGRYDEAIDMAARVRLPPADARALVTRARALSAKRDWVQADIAWRSAVRRDPNNWQLQYEWALALVHGGHTRKSLRRYARARELNPNLPAR